MKYRLGSLIVISIPLMAVLLVPSLAYAEHELQGTLCWAIKAPLARNSEARKRCISCLEKVQKGHAEGEISPIVIAKSTSNCEWYLRCHMGRKKWKRFWKSEWKRVHLTTYKDPEDRLECTGYLRTGIREKGKFFP